MITTTFNSATCYVINDAPRWGGKTVDAQFSMVLDQEEGLTRRETRRPFGASIRVPSFKYQSVVKGSNLTALQLALRNWTTQNIIIPFYPAQTTLANASSSPITGGLMIVWKSDWSNFGVYTGSPPGWAASTDNWAPALFGYLNTTLPELVAPDVALWDVDFVESSPVTYALGTALASFTDGPKPSGYSAAPKIMPVAPNWQTVSEQIAVNITRKNLSLTRELTQTYYPQVAAARTQESEFTMRASTTGAFLRFFSLYMGLGASFWQPSIQKVSGLTADASSGDTVINVDDTTTILSGDYLAFFDAGSIVATGRVSSTGAGTVTLASAIGAAVSKSNGVIFHLNLSRIESPSISISWQDTGLAVAKMRFIELPAEYAIASGETLGTTLGQLAQRVILLTMTRDLGNGTIVTTYWTPYEQDITTGGHTYVHSDWGVGDLPTTVDMESDSVDLKTFTDAIGSSANPLIDDLMLVAEAPLGVSIDFADFDGTTVSNRSTVWQGTLVKIKRNGKEITGSLNAGPAVLENQLPGLIHGPSCNHTMRYNDGTYLMSVGCTLLKSTYQFSAKYATSTGAYPFTLNLTNLASTGALSNPTTQDYYALGWAEWGSGANLQRRAIIGSSVPSGTSLNVTLDRWWNGTPSVGDTIYIYPGCDGLGKTCRTKFNNYINFGGEEFTPVGNPSLTKLTTNPANGAKK